jgi:ribosomal protein S27E
MDDLQEKIDDNLINFKSFLTKKLFSNLKLIKNKSYVMKCIYCDNRNIIMSSKYVLQRCNKCNKEYIPKIKK